MSFQCQPGFTDMGTPMPYVGRGRGVLGLPIPFQTSSPVVTSGVLLSDYSGGVLSPSGDNAFPVDHLTAHPNSPKVVNTSTPKPMHDDAALKDQMSTIIQQVGQQLADNIVTHLNKGSFKTLTPIGHNGMGSTSEPPPASQVLDLSQVQFVTQRKVKEPPTFRGESSDSISLCEWEDNMRNYIKKSNLKIEDQAEEILLHLRGRAKDIVKFGIRNSAIDIQQHPEAIYSLLRKHFNSRQCSPIPLADFYTTLPKDQENPYEYWLRLNRAADVAVDCLKEQGKELDNPSVEITRMFIRNCPSKDLALTFRSKTIDKWSAHEVQDVLNEYHSEMTFKATVPVRREINAIEVSSCPAACSDKLDLKQPNVPDNSTLERVIGMLEKVLLHSQNSSKTSPGRRPNNSLPKIEGLNDTPCSICKDVSHSALSHCRENRLCFQCHSPGHSRLKCPGGTKPTPPCQKEN